MKDVITRQITMTILKHKKESIVTREDVSVKLTLEKYDAFYFHTISVMCLIRLLARQSIEILFTRTISDNSTKIDRKSIMALCKSPVISCWALSGSPFIFIPYQ